MSLENRYISFEEVSRWGVRHCHDTGESIVFYSAEAGRVYKYKNPYAKGPMKHVPDEELDREYLVHNLLFPETPYTLEGISSQDGEKRFVLSQEFVPSIERPSDRMIASVLKDRGLLPEGHYSYGNELVSVMDVEGDNTLVGRDGRLYFIDPIIRFKKPVDIILEKLQDRIASIQKVREQRGGLLSSLKQLLSRKPLSSSERWDEVIGKATDECVRKGIPVTDMNVQYMAREMNL